MASRETAFVEITPEVLLKAYACGIFPMAESAEDPALHWIEPEERGVIPLDTSMCGRGSPAPYARTASPSPSTATSKACSTAAPSRSPAAPHLDQRAHPQALPQALRHRPLPHRRGLRQRRAGRRPLWRLPRPRVFRREHVPSRPRRLEGGAGASGGAAQAGGFTLLDTQFVTDHLQDFGATEVPRRHITSCWKHRWLAKPTSRRSAALTGAKRCNSAGTGGLVVEPSPQVNCVMAGHSRPKDGVARSPMSRPSTSYVVPAWMPATSAG